MTFSCALNQFLPDAIPNSIKYTHRSQHEQNLEVSRLNTYSTQAKVNWSYNTKSCKCNRNREEWCNL